MLENYWFQAHLSLTSKLIIQNDPQCMNDARNIEKEGQNNVDQKLEAEACLKQNA